MYILFYITVVILFLYGILINYYERSWRSIPEFITAERNAIDGVRISVVIPARNEALNITRCLESLQRQRYSSLLFEVLVVNDHSTDETVEVVSNFRLQNLKLIHLRDYIAGQPVSAFKKKAIEAAVANASGELIVTTDADCTVAPAWLETIASFYKQTQAAFIAAPVKMEGDRSLLSIFQILDFLTLQGITAASVHNRFHSMSNGANLAYQKKIFEAVDGFAGIDHIASGDDMLLMQKVAAVYPDKLYYLKSKEVIVTTAPEKTWKAFINQRIRWASKSGSYNRL